MGDLKIVIDSTQVSGQEGMTIFECAKQVGIEIPTLCHSPDLSPTGACRVCVVEVEGSRTLVGSCHTPIADRMVIHTRSPKVLAARKAVIELLLASHASGTCVVDVEAKECELHKLASDLEVVPPRFQVRKPYYPIEDVSPYIHRDLTKCILCRRCIRACSEIAKKYVFSIAYRGFNSKIVVDFDEPLNKEVCRDCDVCIDYCPTGALSKPSKEGVK